VDQKPIVCSPLSVVSNSAGKLRLVLNLRYLNQFIHTVKFKYKDLRTAALLFEKDEYLFKSDLNSGYHHLDIHHISWNSSGEKQKSSVTMYFQYSHLAYVQLLMCLQS